MVDTITVKDAGGVNREIKTNDALMTLVGEVQGSPTPNTVLDRLKALLTGIVLAAGDNRIGEVSITDISDGDYETVAASQTEQVIGSTGGVGDYLAGLLIVPASADPGAVAIKDGSGPAITVFEGGEGSVSNLVPFFVPLGIKSTDGAWQVTTGEDVSVVASGNFT